MAESSLKIAIVGAGVAGITAAHYLARKHRVTLLEKNSRLGGHTNTFSVSSGPDRGLAVDTGFIVCNPKNYPNFYRFLDQLGVERQDSDMTFGYHCSSSGRSYMGPGVNDFLSSGLTNILNFSTIKMLLQRNTFNKTALRDLHNNNISPELTLGGYLEKLGVSDLLKEQYIIPIAAAIWSSPDDGILDFPALMYLRFFENHGMLELARRPQWQTVSGGSHSYIKAFQQSFNGQILTGISLDNIERSNAGIRLSAQNKFIGEFDRLVLACHADQALKLLEEPSPGEKELLGAWNYQKNSVVLHSDTSIMPESRKLWASWNYHRLPSRQGSSPVAITYYMNRLQKLKSSKDYLVTLNQDSVINPQLVHYKINYMHPVYTPEAILSQKGLRELNGQNNTYFCGSYMRHGFHEDAVSSAISVVEKLGVEL